MPFQIVRNDITKMQVDAIVNTANPMPGYGAGIDTAVYEAAGVKELLAKRHEIGVIERGCSVITDGYKLPARYIIHTVGTAWQGGDQGEEDIIRSCYRSVFKLALENDIQSLATPLLASGSYGFPKGIALRIALSETEAFLADHDMDIFLVVFDEKSFALSSELYGDIDTYINDNYVEEKSKKEYPGRSQRPGRVAEEAPIMSQSMASDRSIGTLANLFRPEQKKCKTVRKASSDECREIMADQATEIHEEVPLQVAFASCAGAPRSLEDAVKNLDKTFMELVFSFADDRGLTDVEVQRRANIDRKAFSKLKCGTTKNPSKATALALAIALRLNLDETKDLLSRAGLALSPCSKQDIIVQYFIEREVYDIYEINIALFEHGEQLLGCAAAS